MFKFHDIEQNTEEWFFLRAGKLTSSKIGLIMANFGKAFGEPAKKYAVSIALEQITGKPVFSGYSNEHMERGHEQEPIARMLYERENFCSVDNGGFFEGDWIGCSPDGLVHDNGVIEIKSVIPSVHFSSIKRQSYDPSYKWQLIANLKFTGRDYIDFISFCSEFPDDKKLFVTRINKETLKEEFKMIDSRLEEFKSVVDEAKKTIVNNKYFLELK